jgi:two-component system KDP operon response regulator KdpE
MNSIHQAGGIYHSRILAVDDEPAILTGLKRHLTARGYEVRTATGGVQALQEIEENPPDLIILDLMMPDKDGLDVTHEVRSRLRLTTPIIVLSARGEEQKKVEALDLGADDYLTKPFGLDELMARIRVALRHSQLTGRNATGSVTPPKLIGDEHLTIDLEKHQVIREGKEIKLTPKQYDLLKYLALNPGKLITHHQFLQAVWGPEYSHEVSYLHVFINQLRQKLEPNPAKPRFILTEPGLGYRFHLPAELEQDKNWG